MPVQGGQQHLLQRGVLCEGRNHSRYIRLGADGCARGGVPFASASMNQRWKCKPYHPYMAPPASISQA